MRTGLIPAVLAVWLLALLLTAAPQASETIAKGPKVRSGELFKTSESCLACHNGLATASGEDISIGSDWRATMMANSSRDPYWQAGVRREMADHPTAAADIQDECSICHMPMARAQAKAQERKGEIFAHLPIGRSRNPLAGLAADGVSCTVCHQITDRNFGTPESFTGGFVLDASRSREPRAVFGPYQVDHGRTTIMQSATEFKPTESAHIRQSELCATCHTLITQALGPRGEVIGRLPEQVMYLEWQHSEFKDKQSCQSCHMPAVEEDTRIASVLGDLRKGFARHIFRGGNFFMLRLLNKYRADLGVEALPQELEISANRTIQHLQSETATVSVDTAQISGGRLDVVVFVQNLTGHKFPTGYPSRRAWLHVTVRDRDRRPVFESGAMAASGLIEGNDADADAGRFEPHYAEINRPEQVQIYESVMGDSAGLPTTGLLSAVRYLKDNRLLPRGFDKTTAEPDVAVVGAASQDANFQSGGDRVQYSVDVAGREGPFQVEVELRFQPVAFRWAQNLKAYDNAEARRFVGYYESMSSGSSQVVAQAAATVR